MHAHIAVKTERRAGSPPDARVMRKVADRDACESHTWQTHDQIELAKEHTLGTATADVSGTAGSWACGWLHQD